MTGQLVLPGSASEKEWLSARRAGITASEIAVVMGLAPPAQDSPYALFHRKRGELPEQPDNDAMERGRVLEPYIAGKFTQLRPEFAVAGDGRALYAHPDRPWQLATPDRLVHEAYLRPDDGGREPGGPPVAVLECKTDAGGEDPWGDEGTDDIPVQYRCQVLWQLDVFGFARAYVTCLFMRSWKIRVYELTLDDQALEDLDLMRRAAVEFLGSIEHGEAPDIDWRPPTTAALKRLHPSLEDVDVPVGTQLGRWYLAACRHVDAARQRKALYENRIRAQLGAGRRAVDRRSGDVIAIRQVYPVRAHTRKAATVDKLVPKPPREPG